MVISARYVHHLTAVFLLFIKFILLFEISAHNSEVNTMLNENKIIAKSVLFDVYNFPLKLKKIFLQKSIAELNSGILKNIQAMFTSKKVSRILPTFTNPLLSHFCIFKAFSIICKAPCMSPHMMNVQFAPCQTPLTRNVTIML